jgi:L-2-hydroxyglutarate oxidase LhgO
VAGSAALYSYCAAKGVPHAKTGKLVVAVHADEVPALDALHARATVVGVPGLERLSGGAALAAEPALAPSVAGALHSPHTGIVDSHALMAALLADAEAGGAVFAPRAAVVGGQVSGVGGAHLDVHTPHPIAITARSVILAAGLGTPRLASRLAGLGAQVGAALPPFHAAKGSYFRLEGVLPPFSRLIYPLPPAGGGGLGVHLTLDLAGRARFGPDVEWLSTGEGAGGEAGDSSLVLGPPGTADPAPSADRAAACAASIRRWWPGLPSSAAALVPDYAGVRPKTTGPGDAPGDFVVSTLAPGVVGLFGIESPGLTAALMLGEAAAASACGDEGWRGGSGGLDVGL